MKCLAKESLAEFAYGLMDEPAAVEVRAHLKDCAACRDAVAQHYRLGMVLSEWKAEEPSPWFDSRVRRAVEAQPESARWDGWEWLRGFALASLGVLIVTGAVWFGRSHRRAVPANQLNAGMARPAGEAPVQATSSAVRTPGETAQSKTPTMNHVPSLGSVDSNDDRVGRAMEDYDLAADFDLLSEVPKGDRRAAE
jgi:hypothetical protein